MAAELVMAGPDKPVFHKPSHDIESMFYVLLGICVFLDEPHKPKKEPQLESCFDLYFNSFHPSTTKTKIIQSNLGWCDDILSHISPYFKPLVPLLNKLRDNIILPMKLYEGRFCSDEKRVTHELLLDSLLEALYSLQDNAWTPILPPGPLNDDNSQIPHIPSSVKLNISESGSANQESQSKWRMPRPTPLREISGSGFMPSPSPSSGSMTSGRKRLPSVEDQRQDVKRSRPMPGTPTSRLWYSSTAPSTFHTKT